MSLSINLPKACGLESQTWLIFCLILKKRSLEYQFIQGMQFEEPDMTKFLFDIQQIVERMTHDIINQKYGEDSFH